MGERRRFEVDPDVGAAPRIQRVLLHDRDLRRRQQVTHLHVRGVRRRVLQQVEEIERRRRSFRLLRRNDANAVGEARQRSEQARQLPIGALCDFRCMLDQVFRRARVKLRIGAQEALECREIAVKAAGADFFFHQRPNARDFLIAEFVNLLGRHVRRRVGAHEIGIVLAAMRDRAQANLRPRGGQVFRLDEMHRLLLFGQNAIMNDRARPGAEVFLIRCRDAGRHLRERRQQRVGHGVELRPCCRQSAIGDDARLCEMIGDAAPGVGDVLVVPGRHGFEPRQPGLCVVSGLDRRRISEVVANGEVAAAIADRHAALVEVDALDLFVDDAQQVGAVEAVLVRKARRGDAFDARLQIHKPGAQRRLRLWRRVRKQTKRCAIALAGGGDGIKPARELLISRHDRRHARVAARLGQSGSGRCDQKQSAAR